MKRSFDIILLNLGHALNHYFLLIFPSVVLVLHKEWDMGYAELLKVGSPAMLIYGLMSLPAGWLADCWSRQGMMTMFFWGMGISTVCTALAQTPLQIGIGLGAMATFAAIYHPVGTALVFSSSDKTGRAIAVNGLAGNLGLAFSAMGTAFLSQWISWRAAFYLPGLSCVLLGAIYTFTSTRIVNNPKVSSVCDDDALSAREQKILFGCVAVVVFFGGLVFQSTTTSLPKIMDAEFSQSINLSAAVTTAIFVCAAFTQLVIGEMIDRVSIKTLLCSVAGGQMLFLLLATVNEGWSLVFVFVGVMLCAYAQIPINDWLIGRYSSTKWRSRIYAIKYMLSFSTGPIAYWMISLIYQQTEQFIWMYVILAAGMLLAALAVLLIPTQQRTSTCDA